MIHFTVKRKVETKKLIVYDYIVAKLLYKKVLRFVKKVANYSSLETTGLFLVMILPEKSLSGVKKKTVKKQCNEKTV
jgi:hypothetical protein